MLSEFKEYINGNEEALSFEGKYILERIWSYPYIQDFEETPIQQLPISVAQTNLGDLLGISTEDMRKLTKLSIEESTNEII